MNGAAWAGRLGIIIAIIIIEKASPALAWFLVLASIIAWAGYLAYAGNYLPRWVVDMIERKQEPVPSAALLTVIDDKELAEKLKDQIVGQDEVIDQIATQVRRRVAARRPDKPIAVFCFAGPPGVGKTELAKVLNETLYKDRNHLHFYSFAEMGKSQASASTLFGAPKGYNGGEGTLTSALRRIPNAVVLLDEIEKAHPDTLKRFLSAWNDGAATDQSTGARSSTSEAIFILTTNANQHEIGELCASHAGTADDLNRKVKDLLSVGDDALAPEVLSRIDTVFAFRPMKGIDIAYVVALQIEKLARSSGLEVAGGGIRKEILIKAVEKLSKVGTKGGVRDIAREIEAQVADGLIDAKTAGATQVRFEPDGDKIRVVAVTGETPPSSADRPATAATPVTPAPAQSPALEQTQAAALPQTLDRDDTRLPIQR